MTSLWRRASKGERCGYCGCVFKGKRDQQPGEPIFLYGSAGLKRCVSCAKYRYGQDVPVPFPEPVSPNVPQIKRPEFVMAKTLAVEYRQRQTGERE